MSGVSSLGIGLVDPMTNRGDIIIRNASNTTDRKAIGAAGSLLRSDGTDPAWTAPTGSIPDSMRNSLTIENLSLAFSVASNALTIDLKGADGNDPSATNIVKVGFRTSATDPTPVIASITAAMTLVVSAGSTLGATSATNTPFLIWLFNDGGTYRLGISNGSLNEADNIVQSSTAEGGAGAADAAGTIYTGTAVVSKPCRIIAAITAQNTTGNWTATPTIVRLLPDLLPGVTDGSSATAGYVGEYMESVAASPTALTTGQYSNGNATAITLTPGTWDIQAIAKVEPAAGTTIATLLVAVGTTTGNSGAGIDESRNETRRHYVAAAIGGISVLSTPLYRVTITSNTSYYPKVYADFGVSTCTGQNSIFARRIR